MQENKLCVQTTETNDSELAQQNEADECWSNEVYSLRFEVQLWTWSLRFPCWFIHFNAVASIWFSAIAIASIYTLILEFKSCLISYGLSLFSREIWFTYKHPFRKIQNPCWKTNLNNWLVVQVSKYTGRIHLYSCILGKDSRPQPLYENFQPEELESLNLLAANDSKETDLKFLKGNPVSRHALLSFIKEWNALRPIERRKLRGKTLQLPLRVELCYLNESTNHKIGVCLRFWFISLYISVVPNNELSGLGNGYATL